MVCWLQPKVHYLDLLQASEAGVRGDAWAEETVDARAAAQQMAAQQMALWEEKVGAAYDEQVKPRPTAIQPAYELKAKKTRKINITQ